MTPRSEAPGTALDDSPGFIETMDRFCQALQDPEYAHLFLEPLLVFGTFFGVLTFLFALVVQEQKTQIFGLIILIGSALLIGPYVHKRSLAEPRIVEIYRTHAPERAEGFAEVTQERRRHQWLYYLTAGLGTATLLVGVQKNRTGLSFSAATVCVAFITVIYGGLLHYRESQYTHPNLRRHYLTPVHGETIRLLPVTPSHPRR